jgi:UDP-glucose:(heptosyl)LPS alpha-1,3-glucosyltransferase
MKIAIILSRIHRFGSSRYVLEVTDYFAKKGHNVHLFATSCDPINNPRVKFHKIPYFGVNFLTKEATISFLHTVNMMSWNKFFEIRLAQPTRYFSPNVCEMQFVYREGVKQIKRFGVLRKLRINSKITPLIERHNLKKAKAVIAISKSVKNEVLKNYSFVPEDIVHVCYSGVNPEEFNPKHRRAALREIRNKFEIEKDELLLLFVGNPFYRKGVRPLIKSLRYIKNKDFKLLISGKDDPEPYMKLAKKLGVSDLIQWNIGLTYDIYKFFAAGDVFVFPTFYEPFGLVIIEAMASGLPIVTSRLAGAAELIDDGKEGLLLENPKNEKEVADKLNYLLDNESLLRKMGRNARGKAERHPWSRTAKDMLEVFEGII